MGDCRHSVLIFVICYLILHHIDLSICLNFLTVRDQFSAISDHLFEFSADNVYRLPLLFNSFLPEYQVCVAPYFLSNHIFELPEFSFHFDLRFVSSFGRLPEISIADECFASLFGF